MRIKNHSSVLRAPRASIPGIYSTLLLSLIRENLLCFIYSNRLHLDQHCEKRQVFRFNLCQEIIISFFFSFLSFFFPRYPRSRLFLYVGSNQRVVYAHYSILKTSFETRNCLARFTPFLKLCITHLNSKNGITRG